MSGVGDGGSDSGRGSEAAGRRETYYRRHDPAAPGFNPKGKGGTEGLPTTAQAFQYHAWDKHSTGEKVGRAVVAAVMPGGLLLQGLMAKSQANRDVAGTEGSFDYNYSTGGANNNGGGDNDPAPRLLKKPRRPLTPGQLSASGQPGSTTPGKTTTATRLSAATLQAARDRRRQGRPLISGSQLGITNTQIAGLKRTLG